MVPQGELCPAVLAGLRERRPLFIGAHFFAPAFIMKLVEVIPALETAEETTATLLSTCERIGKP